MARQAFAPLAIESIHASYIAGLIDGEGCIGIHRVARPVSRGYRTGYAYRGAVSVTMTTPEVLHWMRDVTGFGQINAKKLQAGRQQTWTWNLCSRQAASLLLAIEPFLIVKRKQARNFIQFQDMCRHTSTKNGLTEAEQAAKELHYEISRFLNRRGVGHEPPSPAVFAWLAT